MRTLFLAIALLASALAAQAHPNLQNAMWVQFEPSMVHVALNVSLDELGVAHVLKLGDDKKQNLDELSKAAQAHGDYLLKHLTLTVEKKALAGNVVAVGAPQSVEDWGKGFVQFELKYPFSGPPPSEVVFSQDMLREWPYAAGTAWNISYAVRAKRSDSKEIRSFLLPLQKETTIPTEWKNAASATGWRTFFDYLRHGVMHILTGYDHLLFVAALVIATMSFWEMAKVIAAFTLAHTVTLTLCVFGIFRLPAFVVEPVIALSIIFVALENVFRPHRAHSRARLAVAFGFGLIHGLGFAGGLLDAMAGLPSIGIWIALAAFSLGVEIGHQAAVLPLFGLLTLSRRKLREGLHASLLRCGSAAISCGGVYFLVVAIRQQFFSH